MYIWFGTQCVITLVSYIEDQSASHAMSTLIHLGHIKIAAIFQIVFIFN